MPQIGLLAPFPAKLPMMLPAIVWDGVSVLGRFLFSKKRSALSRPSACRATPPPSGLRPADRLPCQTVASFPILAGADPLLSIKSVASFFKKALDFQPLAISFRFPGLSRLSLCLLPTTYCLPSPAGYARESLDARRRIQAA